MSLTSPHRGVPIGHADKRVDRDEVLQRPQRWDALAGGLNDFVKRMLYFA
jgi:hypothetical protein